MADEEIKFEMDEFIAHVIPDPTKPRGTYYVTGYLGESDKEGCIRVYHDPGLNYYADIKKEDVVYLLKMPQSLNPLGGAMLWLKVPEVAPVQVPQVSQDTAVAQQYFQGNLYNMYVGQQPQAPQTPKQPTKESGATEKEKQ